MLFALAKFPLSYSCSFLYRIPQTFRILQYLFVFTTSILADVEIDEADFETFHIELPALNGNSYIAERYSGINMGPEKFSWVGKLIGNRGGVVSFGRVKDSISLKISFSNLTYFYRGKFKDFVWQKKTSVGKNCGGCVINPNLRKDPRQRRAQSKRTWQNGDGNLIDLVIVYPEAVRTSAGSTEILEADILSAVADANLCFRNSQVNIIARLVHMEEISYTPTGVLSTDLDRLIDKNDTYLDNVHAIRDQYGGDIVILLTTASDGGGLASTLSYPHHDFESSAFNVTVWDQMGAPDYTLTHEIGHNMGCLHNIEDTSNTSEYFVFSGFSYGKRWTSVGQGFRTVMSYDTDPSTYPQLIPYFSNPEVSYVGVATGNSNSVNNARVLRSTAPYVANFRSSIVQGIISSNYDVRVYEGNFYTTFGVRLAVNPNTAKVVSITNSGDSDLFLGSSPTLTFDSSNWNLEQTVQVLARADSDSTAGAATLVLSSDGISSTSVPLTEADSGTTTQTELYLSGVVTNSLGVGIVGVEISFSNNGGSATSDSMGAFVHRLSSGWAGVITPSKDNFSFTPSSIEVSSLSVDQLGIEFTGNQPTILYVDTSATGSGDGSSWSNAYTDLGDALSSKVPYDEVWVAQGTYKPGIVRSAKFIIPPNKQVFGGFAGTESIRSERDPANNLTTLSGDLGLENDFSDNAYHVVIPLQNSSLDGLTIRDGNASENFGDGDDRGKGGGLYAHSTTFSIINCTFSNNIAKQGGAAIYLKDSNATISACTFTDNSANSIGSGGALLIEDSNISISYSSFQNNMSAYEGGAIRFANSAGNITDSNLTQNQNTLTNGAGAVYLANSPITFENCIFLENSTLANNYGGAIKLSSSSASFSNSFFIRNTCSQNSAGAIYIDSNSSPTFSNNEFHYNSSGEFGGAIVTESSFTFTGGSFLGNSANYGGAISSQASINLTLEQVLILGNESNASNSSSGGFAYFGVSGTTSLFVNCVISGNKSTYRNGVLRPAGLNRFVNCTIVGNESADDGGITLLFSGDSVELDNSIVWGNTSGTFGNDFFVNGQSVSANHSIFNPSQSSETISGSNNQNVDPGFIDANGVDNLYGTIDDNLSLTSSSPAINSGSAGVSNYPSSDIYGNARAGLPDLGPYELLENTLPVFVTDSNQTIYENTTLVQVSATDANGNTLVYSTTGGADESKFSIQSGTGELSFLTTPDYETPTDAGSDNVYNVQVAVSDGVGSPVLLDLEIAVAKDPSTLFTVSGGEFSSPYYTFTDGNGQTPDFSVQSLYLGETYTFSASGISGSHPFMIGESYGDMDSSLVSGGSLTGTGGSISVSIPSNFTGTLSYFCTNHSGMDQSFTVQSPPHIVELNGSLNLEMLWIEPGSFTMGTPTSEAGRGTDENETQVTFSRGFYLGKYEVTQAEYEFVMTGNSDGITATPSYFPGHSARPVERIKYGDTQVFIQRLNDQMSSSIPAGWAYVLPTEGQWEYACRAGTTTAYSWGGSIAPNNANYNWDGDYNSGIDYQQTRDVGQYSPNAWGFYDMHGNVREWVADWYGGYTVGPLTDPSGATSGSNRVNRGGAWWDTGIYLRSGVRYSADLNYINGGVGFRIAFQDINNAPINLGPITVLSVEENQPVGTVVGELNSSDPDGNSISYFLVNGQGDDNNNLFTLEENGTLKSSTILDFESSSSILSIRVQARDEFNATTDGSFSVLLIDSDDEVPVFSLVGASSITHEVGTLFYDQNATWTDNVDGNGTVSGTGSVNPNILGIYILSYNYTDSNGNAASTVTRTVTVVDTTAPILSIIGDQNLTHEAGLSYTDSNATWSDHVDGSGIVTASESVDSNTPGTYVLSYNYTDSNGNAASTVSRTVTVVDLTAPVLTVTGDQNVTHEAGLSYTDANATWSDHVDGNGLVTSSGSVDSNTPGTYVLNYNYTDSNGNAASIVTRTVTVVDTTAPILSIIGDQNITHEAGLSYTDANATWSDHVDGSGLVTSSGSVDSNTPGTYVLSYNYTDTNGNVASTVTRTVTVVDTTAPILSIIGDQNITHEAGLVYSDANATWSDHVDGNGIIASSESVDSNTLGTYVLNYNYTDSNGNAASTVTRTVTVVDSTAPVLTVTGDQNVTHEAGLVYLDTNATWSDHVDGNGIIASSESVDSNTPGTYVLNYNYTDSNGNAASTVSRTVTVVDTTAPVLTVTGDQNVTHEAGLVYLDTNATWSDHVDGNGMVAASESVDSNTPDTYVLSYNYTDSNGNAASTVTRTVMVVDTTAPQITLNGVSNLAHKVGLPYEDENATWSDLIDGNGTILATGSVNINVTGIYLLSYDYIDSSGNAAVTKFRSVTIFEGGNPVIILNGDQNITHFAGQEYYDANATWVDTEDGNGTVLANGNIDTNVPGVYALSYNYTDSGGNVASTVTRTVIVVDNSGPVLSLNGDNNITHEAGLVYSDGNATWSDFIDGEGTVTAIGNVDTNLLGTYVLSYNYTDSSGNEASAVTRSVTVVDTTDPVLILNGDSNITHEAGLVYLDDNATWSDFVDGSGMVTASGDVNVNTAGAYLLSYNYTDSSGNVASDVTRIINVVDTTPPLITINGASTITQEVGIAYLDANAIRSDLVDGYGTVLATGNVDINIPGTYELSYNYIDSSGNAANTVVRKVIVVGNTETDDTEITSFKKDWIDATPVVGFDGWWESQWMGFYSADSYPWIYHQNLGWIFVSIESSEGIWFYHSRLGWLWTNPYQYPYLFLVKRDQWIYLNQSNANTMVYDYEEEEWFEPDTPIGIFANDDSLVGGEVTGYGYYYRWDPVTLEAKEYTDYNFASWSGDINSTEKIIVFEALGDLKVDASFLAIPSRNISSEKVIGQILSILDKMEHLSEAERNKSLAELLIFGKSSISGLSIIKNK
jgi:formylglycine-generating enzyme required for sulfatase activity